MAHECLCGCGKIIPYRKRPREKLYYSAACRQRACRKRNKDRHDLDRVIREADERFYLTLYQDFHKETWEDELKEAQARIAEYEKRQGQKDDLLLGIMGDNKQLEEYIDVLEKQLAEKEAEIIRLNMLLEGSKKHPHKAPQ